MIRPPTRLKVCLILPGFNPTTATDIRLNHKLLILLGKFGTPKGNRTLVTAAKGAFPDEAR